MQQLRVHGQRESDSGRRPSPLERALPKGTIEVKHSVRVGFAREGHAPTVLDGVAPDDVIEMELDGGVRLWSSVDYMRDDFGLKASRDASGSDVLDISTQLPLGGQSRGVGDWVIRGLKVLGVDIAGTITDFVADKVEGQLKPRAGLYRCSPTRPEDFSAPKKLTGKQPTLVFLHGTGSSTQGSFGALWDGPGARISDLVNLYGENLLALQHRTLSQSPIENARDLVAGAGQGAARGLRAAPRVAFTRRSRRRARRARQPYRRRFVRSDRPADHQGQRPRSRCGGPPGAARPARQATLRRQPVRPRRLPEPRHDARRRPARQVSVGDSERARNHSRASREPRVRHVRQPARGRRQEADRSQRNCRVSKP